MADTIVINGRETGRPGVYAKPEFLRLQSRPPLSSILAIVGEFPFLKKNTPYLSTHQAAFDALSPSSETRKRLSNIVFDASNDEAIQSSPAGVYLISPMTVGQAIGYLQNSAPANVIKILARQWGLEGNRTFFSIVQNATLGGWNVSVKNGTVVENIRIKSEPNLLNLSYATPGSPSIPTGFGTAGGADAGSVSLAVSNGVVSTTFSVTVDESFVYVAPLTTTTWTSQAPVDGVLAFNSSAAATIGAGKSLSIKITGTNKATGASDTETVSWSKTDIEAQTPPVFTKTWTGAVTVSITEATSVTFSGEITITGKVFPDFSAASGYTYVSSVINHIANYSSVGFTVTTDSTRVASAALADLDDLSPDTLPAALTSVNWKIVSSINAKSVLVSAERVADSAPTITTTATSFFLAGGTETAAVAADWEAALEELQWYDIDVVVPFYDPTGVDPTEDTILPLFKTHLDIMWADGANERVAWFPAGTDETFAELTARVTTFGDYRISLPVDGVSMVQFNSQVENLDPYWTPVLMGAMDASTNGLVPLTYRSPRITDYTRNSNLFTSEVMEEMIKSGMLFFIDPPGSDPQVQRDITTFPENDARRTERVAVRSLMLSIKFMRRALKRYIVSPDGSIATLADVRAGVTQELDRQRTYKVFRSYDASKVVVTPYADRFEVEYEIVPLYPINFIILRVKVTAPISPA